MLTTDPNEPKLKEEKPNGQMAAYLVMTPEERLAGYTRPLRYSYVHVGGKLKYKTLHRMLTEEERKEMIQKRNKNYVAIMTILTNEDGSFKGGTYITAEEFKAWQDGVRVGGCGGETTMGHELAETYAVNPKFYSATYCAHCGKHLPVNEFFWSGTNEEVGS